MATAQEVVNRAAELATIKAIGKDLESGRNTYALDSLNRMHERWRNKGIDLKLPTLTGDATVFVDEADLEAIELNLSLRLSAKFKRPVDPAIFNEADVALRELQGKYGKVDTMQLDRALTRKRHSTFQFITSG